MDILRQINRDAACETMKPHSHLTDITFESGEQYGKISLFYKGFGLGLVDLDEITADYFSTYKFKVRSVNSDCFLTWPCTHECEVEFLDGSVEWIFMASRQIAELYERFGERPPEHFIQPSL